MSNRFLRIVFATLALFATAALAVPASAQVVLHRGNGAEPESLDPHKAQGHWEANIMGDMILGLTTESAEGKPIAGAAVSWTTSEDGYVWTFKLREGAKWSDGTPVTADDFVFAWRRLLDPKTAAQYASILYIVKNAEAVNGNQLPVTDLGVRAVDPMTFEVTLSHPAPYLLEITMHQAAFPVPKHMVERLGDAWANAENSVSNGAYVLAEWRSQDYVKLVKNPGFYDAANVQVDEVYFYPTPDSEAALQRFRAGELDMQDPFPASKIGWLRENMPTSIQLFPYLGVTYTVFNVRREKFQDVRVRTALSMVYPREIISERIYGLGEPAAYTFVPPATANYPGTPHLAFKDMPMEQRAEEAKRLLAEAGYGPDNPLRFTFNYINDPDGKRSAAVIQDAWKRIGVEVTLIASEAKVHYTSVLQTHDFDAAAAAWIGDFNDAENFLFMLETNNEGFNYGGWTNPKFDELMQRSRFITDLVERGRVMAEAEQILLDEVGISPARNAFTRYLVSPQVEGFVGNAREIFRTRWLSVDRSKPSAAGAAGVTPQHNGSVGEESKSWFDMIIDWFAGIFCSWFGIWCS